MSSRRSTRNAFLAGLSLGLAGYYLALMLAGMTPVKRHVLEELKAENQELTDDLFKARLAPDIAFDQAELPYDEQADAMQMLATARDRARGEAKFLMVTFGANWCLDCRTLHHRLHNEPVASYAADHFLFVNVDVGKFNRNQDVAESLGVSLTRGIPVAIFFDPNGEIIGTTNEGQLEPARHYSSSQILKFMRDIAVRSRILAPDSVD